MTVLILLVAWLMVSIPAAVLVGLLLRSSDEPDLFGMDGLDAVYVDGDGHFTRVPLLTEAPDTTR